MEISNRLVNNGDLSCSFKICLKKSHDQSAQLYRAPLVAGVATGNNSSRRFRVSGKIILFILFFCSILYFCISQNVLINEFMMKYAYGAGLIEIFIHL